MSSLTSLETSSGLSTKEVWDRFVEFRALELLVWVAVLVVLTTVAIFIIKNIRAKAVQQEPEASQLLSKFREQRSKGELSEEEFRGIRATLAVQLKEELKDNGKTG